MWVRIPIYSVVNMRSSALAFLIVRKESVVHNENNIIIYYEVINDADTSCRRM